MSPLCKMSLERLGPLVGEVSANLALVRYVEPVEFVEPVGDGFAVPAQGQVLGVVGDVVFFVTLVRLFLGQFIVRVVSLELCPGLFSLHVLPRGCAHLREQLGKTVDLGFQHGHLPLARNLFVIGPASCTCNTTKS